ncbi:8356_t:CDS:2 [Cetraspora pellucida]|uniref:8356_t:CDS:1 n=1 Tax=Cetraspora pellucida TaxID=1433469 RepID=A0A9N9EC84_9GLOM|nr:8356_t:CDS:2 [Cetraspora pellucida]
MKGNFFRGMVPIEGQILRISPIEGKKLILQSKKKTDHIAQNMKGTVHSHVTTAADWGTMQIIAFQDQTGLLTISSREFDKISFSGIVKRENKGIILSDKLARTRSYIISQRPALPITTFREKGNSQGRKEGSKTKLLVRSKPYISKTKTRKPKNIHSNSREKLMGYNNGFKRWLLSPLITENAQKLLGFRFKEDWYYYHVLPFELSQVVWVFLKVMRAVIRHWHSMGIYCRNHIDDIWIAHPEIKILKYQRDYVIGSNLSLDCLILAEKGSWKPTLRPKFYGLILDTMEALVIISDEKLKTAKRALKYLATQQEKWLPCMETLMYTPTVRGCFNNWLVGNAICIQGIWKLKEKAPTCNGFYRQQNCKKNDEVRRKDILAEGIHEEGLKLLRQHRHSDL